MLQVSYSYDLPVGRGKMFLGGSSLLLDAVIGGWKTNGVWRVNDGKRMPFTTYDGTPLPTYGSLRPNLAGTPKRNHQKGWINN